MQVLQLEKQSLQMLSEVSGYSLVPHFGSHILVTLLPKLFKLHFVTQRAFSSTIEESKNRGIAHFGTQVPEAAKKALEESHSVQLVELPAEHFLHVGWQNLHSLDTGSMYWFIFWQKLKQVCVSGTPTKGDGQELRQLPTE